MVVVSRPVVQLWAGRAGDESLTAAGVAFRNVPLRPVAYIGAIAAEPVGADAAEAHIYIYKQSLNKSDNTHQQYPHRVQTCCHL